MHTEGEVQGNKQNICVCAVCLSFFFLSAGQHQKRTHLLMTGTGFIPTAAERQKADERDIKRFNYAMEHACWVIYHLYAQTSLRGSPPINTTAYWASPLGYPEGSSNSELVQI